MLNRKSAFALPGVAALIFGCLSILPVPALKAQNKSTIYLGPPKRLETSFQGDDAAVQALNAGKAKPLSLAADDFDADGMTDLAAGYATSGGGRIAIFRGNLDAFAPQNQISFEAIGRGEFPPAYLGVAQTIAIPEAPDFLAAGTFIGHDGPGLITGSRGGNRLYILAPDSAGNFQIQQVIDVPGAITGLAAFKLNAGTYTQAVVGVHGGDGPTLQIYAGANEGLAAAAGFPLTGDATAFAFGDLDGDGRPDVLVVAGGQISILHNATRILEPVSVPFKVASAALGSFVSDRAPLHQMALLAEDGSVHIYVHAAIDPRPHSLEEMRAHKLAHLRQRTQADAPPVDEPRVEDNIVWKEFENFPDAGAFDGQGKAPQFFRTRIMDNGADDIMILGGGRLSVIAHPGQNPTEGTVVTRPEQVFSAAAALPVRVTVDGRPGVVLLKDDALTPFTMTPLPDPTFFVNRFDDPVPGAVGSTCNNASNADTSTSCSLREAVRKANATAGTDTIMLVAGTYTLSQPRQASPSYDATSGALDVLDSVNIIGTVDGSNNPTSIILGGSTSGNGVDQIFRFNPDENTPFSTATVSISNLDLKWGFNRGSIATLAGDGDGGAFYMDTGGTTAATATGTLTITNCIIESNQMTDGEGGGFAAFNTLHGPGVTGATGFAVTMINSTVQNNIAKRSAAGAASNGGGIQILFPSSMLMTNSKVLSNSIVITGTTNGAGGGINYFGGGGVFNTSTIHGGLISGNGGAVQSGGGIFSTTGLTIDQSAVISNNTSLLDGGGIWWAGHTDISPENLSLTKVTITGNAAQGTLGGGFGGSGGGILASVGASMTMHFSRLAGNTAQQTGSRNLFNQTPSNSTNNWWGTNAPSTTITDNSGGVTTFDPFIVLTHMGSPQKIRINQSSGLTADMSKDNHGNGAALAGNLSQIIGLPITFDNPILGSISGAQTNLSASAMATATFNAGPTAGRGSANATVDQAVVPVNSNLIATAVEAGTTVTITTVGAHGYSTNEYVSISGVGVAGYTGNYFKITSTPTATSFTYTSGNSGLASSSGGTANAGIVILQPPSIAKSFNSGLILSGVVTAAVGATVTTTFSLTNANVIPIDSSFTDTLPTGLVVASTPNVVNNCGGTVTAVAGSGTISFANPALPASMTPCTIMVDVKGTADGMYTNSVQILSTDAGNGNTAMANITVINPPTAAKAFGAATIPLNGTTSLTVTLTSTNATLTLNSVSFTDSLPAGLVTTGAVTNNGCGGTATSPNSSTLSLSGGTLTPGASCNVVVTVQGTTAGVKSNSVQATSSNAGSGNTSNASLSVVAPPTISKAFSPTSVALNANSTVTFTIVNPNTFSTLSGVGFSDSLPSGLVVASSPAITNTCGGSPTAVAGSSTISLTGGTLTASPAAGSTCTLSVSVTGTTAGDKSNTTGAVTSTEGGTGNTSNTAVLSVLAPPSIAKVFNPNSIALNATTSLQFTITNPAANTAALTGVAFSDTLPTGLTVANASATVCGGTLTTTNPTGISLTGATIAVNSQCVFSVTVTGATAGAYTNTTGTVSATNGGTGNTASANLSVVAPPSITKSFGNASIPANSSTTLSFTITNPNTFSALSGVAFTDTLPAGLVVAAIPNITGSCGSGTITANAGAGSVSLSGGTLTASPSAGSSCTFSVSVTGTTGGVKNNSVQVTSTEGGTGNTSNASVTVVGPPTISKAFNPTNVALNGNSTVTFTIANPNTASSLSGVGFSDTLPSGLVVASSPAVTNTCGGSPSATAGTSTISLSGGTLTASPSAGSTCTLSVAVTGTTAGSKSNTTGAVTSTEGGSGNTSNTAVLTVVAPPSIAKLFNPATIALNATTSLQFTITNPAANTVSLTGVAFSDTLPTGLTVATASATVCGGTLTTTNPTGISLTGATIAANSQCVFSVTVTGAASGNYTNTTGTVSSTNGGTGNTATANLTVAAAPQITKSFNPTQIAVGASTTLSFTIANPNTNVALSGVAFTDTLPAGLVVAATPNITGTCGSGTITANPGAGSVSLSGGTLPSSTNCMFSVAVTGTTGGVKNNSVQVTSTEGGTGNTSNASVTVVGPPTVSKAFSVASIPLNGVATITFTVMNTSATAGATGISFNDTLPAGLVVANPANASAGTCTGTFAPNPGDTSLSISGIALSAGNACTVKVDVKGIAAGIQVNSTGPVSSMEGGTGAGSNTATITVVAPPTLAKAFGAGSIALNATTTLTFTIMNPAANTGSQTGIAFTDTLPAGLIVVNPPDPNTGNTCGGTVTAANGGNSISFANGTIAVNTNCTFAVTVQGTTEGSKLNTTGTISSTEGGTGSVATATIVVGAPATISKAFGAAQITVNNNTSLTFTLNNPNTVVDLTGVAFSDTLPAGLVVASSPNVVNGCNGVVTASGGGGGISLSGGTLAHGTMCTISLNVTGTTAGVKNNVTGNISSNEGGTGGPSNTATVTVVGPPIITKSFLASSLPLNGSTTITFSISNPNSTVGLTGVNFSDTLISGLVVAATPNVMNTCNGTPSATGSSIGLSAGTIAAGGSCTLKVDVTGTSAGDKPNTTSAIGSTEGGTGFTSNTATVNIVAPPTLAKAFGVANIPLNGTTSLTFTVTNPAANTVSQSGVAFTDTLPSGLLVATPNGLTPGCGTVTATAGGNSITLSSGSVGINTNCTFSVNVTGTSEGSKLNTTGTISSTNGGTGTVATASVTVAAPPTIAKAFGAASIPQGANTSLTFTITNPNTVVTLNGIAFTDTLPAGIVVATPSNLTNNCGGSPTASGGTVSLSGGTRAPGASCTVSVTVTGTTSGVKNNSVSVTSTEGGTGNTSNASITVVGPPTIAKAFGTGAIPLNGQTTLTFTLTNTSATINQTGLAFSDTLPAGLVVGTPGSVSNTCNGTLTAVTGTGTVSLAAGTLNAAQQCTIVVNVQGVTPGAKVNTSGVVSSNEGGTGSASNTATLNVDGPPSIAKAFGAPNIALNATTSLTFTITNPAANADPQNGVTFTDTLPAGLVVATPNGLTGQCNGAVTATAGSGVITLAGGSIPVNSNCSFSVNVTGTTSGIKTNTTSTVSSTNGGSGNAATATISVALPPTISKAFGAASIPLSGSTSLTFTLANPNSSQSLSGIQFTDSLPAGLMVASPTGASNTCNGTFAPGAGNTTLTFTGGVIPANGTCSIAVNVAASSQGAKINTTGAISSNESGAGATSNTATLNVVAPPTISKSFSPSTIDLFGTTTLTFTIGNPGGNPVAENGVTFSDTLPAGLVVASTPNVVNNCGGSVTAAAGSGSISLANGTASNTCTIAVNVTANSGGVKNNVSGNVSSTNGGTGNTAAASVTVRVADLVISKSHTDPFAAGSPLGTYTLTVSNIGPVASFGPVTVTDQLPNGLTPTTLQGTGWNCNLLTLTCSRSDALAPGASYPAITLTVSVSPTTAITVTNNATVSGGAEVNTSNDTAMDVTNVTCAYSFAPPSAFFSGAGGNGSFLVITGPGCPIAPVNNASFVSNVTVSGNTVNFSVAQNILFTGRSGSITVGGQAFTVQQAGVNPLLTIVPQKLVFLGDTVTTPPSQTVSISGNDGAFFDVTVDVPWAKVSRDSTQLPATLTVSVSPAGLKPGNYTGTITVNVGGTSTTIFIQYTVFGLSLIPSPTQLTFTYVIGGPLPASQQLTIFAQNTIAITAAPGGAGFVSVSPSSGTTPQVFTVSVDPSNLGVGSYPASVVISGNGVSNSPLVVPITLIVSATGPQFTAAGVVNAASFLAEPLAPGSLFTIFGVNLANNTLLAPGPGLPTSLGGVSMTIGGIPVPLQFISPGQVNAQVPFELGLGQQQLVYTNNGVTITITVTIVPAEPGVFIVNGRGAILNQNNTLNTPLNPAVVGSAVQVFFTGQGLVTPPLATGAPASLTTLMFTNATTTATIGGAPATVIFSGLAPGFVGLGQANVLVPSLATDDYTLILRVNGQDSNGVKVAVKAP
ncbi:MAG: hypothetical protein M3O35_05320 [Acidobacteriota bacterium]|nr:hypothetical protein [Acidobacteriota bacterium]